MHTRTRRLHRSLLGVTAAALVLSGCTQTGIAPIYGRLVDGKLELLVCHEMSAQYVRYSTADSGSIDYKPAWEAQGSTLTFARGETMSYGELPQGWTESAPAPTLSLKDSVIEVMLGDEPGSTDSEFLTFGYLTEWLSEDYWVNEMGNRVKPCE